MVSPPLNPLPSPFLGKAKITSPLGATSTVVPGLRLATASGCASVPFSGTSLPSAVVKTGMPSALKASPGIKPAGAWRMLSTSGTNAASGVSPASPPTVRTPLGDWENLRLGCDVCKALSMPVSTLSPVPFPPRLRFEFRSGSFGSFVPSTGA